MRPGGENLSPGMLPSPMGRPKLGRWKVPLGERSMRGGGMPSSRDLGDKLLVGRP